MELNEHCFLEELLALRKDDSWESTIPKFPGEMDDNSELFSSSEWSYDSFFNENPPMTAALPNTSPLEQDFNSYYCNEAHYPFHEELSPPHFSDELSAAAQFADSSHNALDSRLPFFGHLEDIDSLVSMLEDDEVGLLANDVLNPEVGEATCKVEPIQSPEAAMLFNVGACPVRKARGKKSEGQPSKNLMAERRRRKRLNDRLAMLRSIVPRISKMDRTSILGDTIDYVKELLERINSLQQEIEVGSDESNMVRIFKDRKASEFMIRNSPKFDVERRNIDTRIEVCCSAKPGLLLSTVTTLEASGLEIEQCVISCFNDFALQASCSEELDQRRVISPEDIKQALFRSAGYRGRCQ